MTETPERIVERQVTRYEVERQCVAPKCGRWFTPIQDTQRWCCKACRNRASRMFLKERGAA